MTSRVHASASEHGAPIQSGANPALPTEMAPPGTAEENPSEPEIQHAELVSEPEPERERPLPPSADETEDEDLRWVQTLSEPELDFLISLKELAVTEAADPCLANRFHLRTLRALGTVLLEHFKDQLKQSSGELDRLALLRDPQTHGSSAQPEVPQPKQHQPMPDGVDRKRKHVHGLGEESALSKKQRKLMRYNI